MTMNTKKATKNVLVCEDDPVQLKILTTMIDQAGYRPISARTPSEAVVAARRCGIDAVLTDVQLQDGNAFDLVGDLRAIGFDAPVFMASAYATDGMKDRARNAGVKRFFDKPFNLPQIREQVDQVLKVDPKLDAGVLIVDGHAQVRAELEHTAAGAGFDVFSASDGAKALDILADRESSIDLLLMDLHAHGSSGAKLIRKALEIRPSLHVIMMSGDADRDEIRAGYEAGASSLVRKPVPADRLQSFLKASLKAARSAEETAQQKSDRAARLAAEPITRKISRWIKSYLHAPGRSRKAGRVLTLTLTATALTVGIGSAYALQGAFEAADRFEAMADKAIAKLALPQGASAFAKQEAMMGRTQGAEQIRLMREANEVTRRYYEGHLQEMRAQNRATPAPQFVAMPESPAPAKR
jgi:DNA-binding response OmpR family regulator